MSDTATWLKGPISTGSSPSRHFLALCASSPGFGEVTTAVILSPVWCYAYVVYTACYYYQHCRMAREIIIIGTWHQVYVYYNAGYVPQVRPKTTTSELRKHSNLTTTRKKKYPTCLDLINSGHEVTLLVLQPCCGDKLHQFQVLCPPNGTAVLKWLKSKHHVSFKSFDTLDGYVRVCEDHSVI